ncbi:MAG: zf-HC2 domain-containing protein [Acutalibacteraceae bacterium]
MNKECEIIKDLLPLYIDNACSSSSTEMIEEHLPKCKECAKIKNSLQSSNYENTLKIEKEQVILHHEKAQKRKTFTVGASIAGVLCVPIIVCLIINLVFGHALDWFFIVLTSLMVFASLSVVPLIAEKQKGVITIFSFTGSLLLLLLSCSLYTKGNWFFVAGTSVLFGLSVIFLPYIAHTVTLTKFWEKNKGLFVLSVETVLFVLMLVCIGFYTSSASYWKTMPKIALYNVGFIWMIFLICRYIKVNHLIRAGITSIIAGAYLFSINNVTNMVLGENLPWPKLNLNLWTVDTVDGNIKWILLLAGILLGLILIFSGIIRQIKSQK